MIILRQSCFTKWDRTDRLKRMKDSDILAEDYSKPEMTYGDVGLDTLKGAAIGGAALSALTALNNIRKDYKNTGTLDTKNIANGLKNSAVTGAVIGGLIQGAKAMRARRKEKKETGFYNRRLKYAKKNALRREAVDWKENMTNRESYTY